MDVAECLLEIREYRVIRGSVFGQHKVLRIQCYKEWLIVAIVVVRWTDTLYVYQGFVDGREWACSAFAGQ